jgi:hypothetical protein
MPCATPDLEQISLVHGLLSYGLLAVNLFSPVTSRALQSLVSASSKDNGLGKSSFCAGADLGRREHFAQFLEMGAFWFVREHS